MRKEGSTRPSFLTSTITRPCRRCARRFFPRTRTQAARAEFIDLLTSESEGYQATLGPGLKWLDATCTSRYGKAWLDCTAHQQAEVLDLIAYRKNAAQDESLLPAVEFFSLLRNLTADAFFTSKVGIKYLGYKGNTYLPDFPGCPPVPGV